MNVGAETVLIARREIVTQVRSKAFLIGNLIMIVLVVGGILAYGAFGGKGHRHTTTIGLTGQTQSLAGSLTSAAYDQGQLVRTTPVAADRAAADVRDGTVDLALATAGGKVQVLAKDSLDQGLLAVIRIAATRSLGARYLQQKGVAAGDYLVDTSSPVRVSLLSPTDPTKVQRWFIAYCGVLIMFISLVQYGAGVATGVVEEKSSRVVELLLATVRPIQLLIGKITGIGAVGILQTAAIGAAALIAGEAADVITVGSTAPLVLGTVLLWYVLGYLFFATLYAAAGSTVSRQEDARSATLPINLLLMVSFYVTAFGSRSGSAAMHALSWIPPFSAFLVPTRVAQSTIGPGEFVVSALIMLGASAAVAVVASRIYQRSILRMGARVSWRQALAR